MKTTRRTLKSENTQLRSQLAAAQPESRKNLKARYAALKKDVEGMTARLAEQDTLLAKLTAERNQLRSDLAALTAPATA